MTELKMMANLNLFDRYCLQARLFPALLALLPGAVGVFAWTGPADKGLLWLWTVIVTAGGTYLLAALARSPGKHLEPELWKSWGGAPTTQLLRHSGGANAVIRERWHKALSKLAGKPFPTPEGELADAVAADSIYEAGVVLLISQTRDVKKFPLLFKENISYGFCRNLYGLRPVGITLSVAGMVLSAIATALAIRAGTAVGISWTCVALCVLFFYIWVFCVRPSLIRTPAFGYANRLMECIELVCTPNAEPAKRADTRKAKRDSAGK
jgi:hypothetical protein